MLHLLYKNSLAYVQSHLQHKHPALHASHPSTRQSPPGEHLAGGMGSREGGEMEPHCFALISFIKSTVLDYSPHAVSFASSSHSILRVSSIEDCSAGDDSLREISALSLRLARRAPPFGAFSRRRSLLEGWCWTLFGLFPIHNYAQIGQIFPAKKPQIPLSMQIFHRKSILLQDSFAREILPSLCELIPSLPGQFFHRPSAVNNKRGLILFICPTMEGINSSW